jgi:hypothetical protein
LFGIRISCDHSKGSRFKKVIGKVEDARAIEIILLLFQNHAEPNTKDLVSIQYQ